MRPRHGPHPHLACIANGCDVDGSGYPPEKANKVENDQAYDNVFIGPEPVATGSRLTATHDSGLFLDNISSGNNYALWIQRC